MATNTVTRTLVNRKGQEIVTDRTDKDAFDELEQQVKDGKASDFAVDLISKGRRYGLSEEQFWWVHKLLEPNRVVEVVCPEIPRRMQDALFNGVKMRNLKVDLRTDQGTAVRLAMAGSRSKYHGDIWVTDDGDYPTNRLFGRIERSNGTFRGNNPPDDVVRLLEAIQASPESHLPW